MMHKIAWICMGIVIMGAMLMTSCIKNKDTPVDSGRPLVTESKNQIDSVAKTLTGTTEKIEINTREIIQKSPEPFRIAIQPNTTSILQQTAIQLQLVSQLEGTKQKLAEAEAKSGTFEQKFLAEQAAKERALDSESKALKKQYRSASMLCGLGAIVFAGLFFTGQIWAKWLSVICGAACAGCIFIVQTADLIPWVVGGVIVIGVVLLAWQFIKKNALIGSKVKEIDNLQVATKELTETVEATKPFMLDRGRREFFGDGPVPGKVRSIQRSDFTIELVKKHRATLTNKAPSVEATIAVDVNGDGVIDQWDYPVEKKPQPTPNHKTPKESKKVGGPRSRIILR